MKYDFFPDFDICTDNEMSNCDKKHMVGITVQ